MNRVEHVAATRSRGEPLARPLGDVPTSNLGDCRPGLRRHRDEVVDEVDGDGDVRRLSYAQLDAQANAVARGLIARGLSRGQRVAVLSPNRTEVLTTALGALRAGLVAVPLSTKLPAAAVGHVLSDSGAALVVTDQRHRQLVGNVATVMFDEQGRQGFESILDEGAFSSVAPRSDEVAMILYTSGSSGHPKGVLLTHAGLGWAVRTRASGSDGLVGGRPVVVAPLYHLNGLATTLIQLAGGASFVLMRRFEPRSYLRAIATFRSTRLVAVPTMMALAAREEDLLSMLDLSCVQHVTLASAPATPTLVETVGNIFPRADVRLSYGTTETGPLVFGPRQHDTHLHAMALGAPFPGVEVELVDGNRADEGELRVRSAAVSPGYLNLPDQTKERFQEGWYRTGDVMRRDAHGLYYFVGRIDDMFVCGGENVHASAVEALLEQHPGVRQAAVVPLDNAVKGQMPVAFVVRRDGVDVDETQLQKFAREHGPVYQYPRSVAFVDELPLVGPNKVDRRLLASEADRRWG